jgi:predicted transcriptional regulator
LPGSKARQEGYKLALCGHTQPQGLARNFIWVFARNATMNTDSLVEIGLTRREAGAYLALLGLEEARAGEVARRLREGRANAYDSLASLVKKGLASFVVRGKATYYRAAPPERLKDLMFEKDKAFTRRFPTSQKSAGRAAGAPWCAPSRAGKASRRCSQTYCGRARR